MAIPPERHSTYVTHHSVNKAIEPVRASSQKGSSLHLKRGPFYNFFTALRRDHSWL